MNENSPSLIARGRRDRFWATQAGAGRRRGLRCAAGDPVAALNAYEAARLEPTAQIVRTDREHPPDFINIRVEELIGDRPFDNLGDFISQDELRALSENYRRVAGFAVDTVVR